MLRITTSSISRATIHLVRHWQMMVTMTVIYALLLAGIYLFVNTKEATTTQILITVGLVFVIPLLFFVLVTASASYTNGQSYHRLIVGSIKNSWKLIAISLPVLALAIGIFYLLNRIQAHIAV